MQFPYNIIEAVSQLDLTFITFALVFIILDILTGMGKAVATKSVSSKIMRQGFWHKGAIVAVLLVACCMDAAMRAGIDIGFDVPVFDAACIYVITMEVVSILENIKEMNPELAETKLFTLLTSFKKNKEE